MSQLKAIYIWTAKFVQGLNFILITKQDVKERTYDDDFLKFLFQLEPENFKGTTAVERKVADLSRKK